MRLFCGDPLCKREVFLESEQSPRWPVRCPACGIALYPADVLAHTTDERLRPRHAFLMAEVDGRRVEARSDAIQAETNRAQDSSVAPADRVLAMVELDQQARPVKATLIAGAIAVAVAAVTALGVAAAWL